MDNVKDVVIPKPVKIAELQGIAMTIRHFIYVESKQLLFLVLSDMNTIARIDAYVSKLSIFKNMDRKSVLGSVICYRIITVGDALNFKHLWSMSYDTRINILNYGDSLDTIIAGGSNGFGYGIKLQLENEGKPYLGVI